MRQVSLEKIILDKRRKKHFILVNKNKCHLSPFCFYGKFEDDSRDVGERFNSLGECQYAGKDSLDDKKMKTGCNIPNSLDFIISED